jgi:riboflavin synthase
MFTGIIQTACAVDEIKERDGIRSFKIACPSSFISGIEIGASVSVDGVCLTVVAIERAHLRFDCVGETLRVSTLGLISVGDKVNLERSLRVGDEIGGHNVSGHVDGTGTIERIDVTNGNWEIYVRVGPDVSPFIFRKGSICLHGVSLTVALVDRKEGVFKVSLIPETLRRTNLGTRRVGDLLNIEIDRASQVIVETLRTTLEEWKDSMS